MRRIGDLQTGRGNRVTKKNESIDDLLGPAPALPPLDVVSYSAEVLQALSVLTPQHAAFVTALAGGAKPVDAYMSAGYSANRQTASKSAYRLMADPAVAHALTMLKADLAKRAAYDFDAFIAELDKAVAFAIETSNATAYVRAVELKGKASGHIVDRVDQRNVNAGFQIQIAGVEPPKPNNAT